ncbi:MAG: hypothetical protein HYZ61_04755, partial [Candidatus Andersenbacteria bacterium]|nr:hypothetical protein [Candidatus Andersenbacteria bacterium]
LEGAIDIAGEVTGTGLGSVVISCTDCINATEIEDLYLFNNGDVGTGVYDFGGATSFEITNGTGPTVDAAGEIAIDTNSDNTNITHGTPIFYDGTSVRYIPSVSSLPTSDDYVLAYDSTGKQFVFQAQSGGGGSTTLTQAYDSDADGSNATIALTTADDSVVISNPSSSGTDSSFAFQVDQNATGAVAGISIDDEGTGLALDIDDAGNADVIDVIAENTGFSNDIINVQSNEEDTGTFNFLKLISDADGTPDTELTINQDGDITTDGVISATGITSTGVVDFGGATSTEITNGTAPTVDATGEIAIDSTDGQVKYFDGTAARTLTYKKQFSTTLESPSDSDNFNLLKAPYALTITSIQCVVDPADSSESAVITVQERDGNGDSPAGVDGATAITCANTNTADDGSLSNGTIDSGDWVSLDIGTVTGTVTQLTVTVNYTVDGV